MRAALSLATSAALLSLGWQSPADASTSSWDGTAAIGTAGDGVNWSDASNWTTGGVIDTAPADSSPGDDITFGPTIGTVDLNTDRVANSLTFNERYTLDALGSSRTLTVTSGAVNVASATRAVIFASLAGGSGLTLSGGGQLLLDGAGLYNGGTTVSSGFLLVNFGTLGGGDLTVSAAGTFGLDQERTFGGNVTNSGSFTTSAKFSAASAGRTFTQSAGVLHANQPITMDAGVFNDNGGTMTGTATLTNSFAGTTLSFGAGPFAGSGSFLLTGGGTNVHHIAGNIPAGYTVTLEPNSPTATTSTLTASTGFTNSGTFNLSAGGANHNDVFTVTGTTTLTNAGTINVNPGPTADGGRTISATINNLAGGTVNINASAKFGSSGTLLNAGTFNIAAGKSFTALAGASHTDITGGAVNLAAGALLELTGTKMNFIAGTITLAADATTPAVLRGPGLSFKPTAGTFTIASGAVAAGQLPGRIDLANGTHIFSVGNGSAAVDVSISADITNGNLTKEGAGTLELTGANSYPGPTSVTSGPLTLAASGSLASPSFSVFTNGMLNLNGSIPSTATVTNSGGTINFGGNPAASGSPTRALALLTLTSSSATTVTLSASAAYPAVLNPTTLTFSTNTGKLDLTNNVLVTTATPASIRTRIIGGQIYTSIPNGVVGYADIGNGQTEVRYTLRGDTNLDGSVDVGDLGALATNYGATSGAAWDQGDFDYDGQVNVNDLGSLATNFGTSLGSGPAFDVASPTAVSSSVPEPAGALALLACGLLRGRRRRLAVASD